MNMNHTPQIQIAWIAMKNRALLWKIYFVKTKIVRQRIHSKIIENSQQLDRN